MNIIITHDAFETADNWLRQMVGWNVRYSVTANNGERFSADAKVSVVDTDEHGYTRVTFLPALDDSFENFGAPFVVALNEGSPTGFDYDSFTVEVY